MVLYDATTENGLRNFARDLTDTDSTTYTDAKLNASINRYYDLATTDILEAMDEWDFQAEISIADLVAGQQEYVFPSDILKIKRIDVKLDGVKWYNVRFMDVNEVKTAADDTTIAANFVTSEPRADLMDRSLMLYPIPTASVTGGIRIWYEKLETLLVDDGDEPNFSRPFHKLLAIGAAIDYFKKRVGQNDNATKLADARAEHQLVTEKMKAFYRHKNQDREYTMTTYDPGYDYGNY